jgi:hypothetical protein
MKTYIQGILAIVLIIGVIFAVSKSKTPTESAKESVEQNTATSTLETASSSPKTVSPTNALGRANIKGTAGLSVPDKAWVVFQNYTEYARLHDIAGVKSLASKFAGICSKVETDPSMRDKCFGVLDDLYNTGITLKKNDFSNSSFDGRQVILSTNPIQTDTGDKIETSKKLIYFTIDTSGEMRLLGLEMGRSFSVEKKDLSVEEINSQIEQKIMDTDKDGVEDRVESCEIRKLSVCTPTDPLKKDSDGDGYWDGIEPLL